MQVRYYVTDHGQCPGRRFLSGLAERFRGQISADLALLGREGEKAPVSKKRVKGHNPMWELRIGGYRVFFVREGKEVFWVLGMCKKQDYEREIAAYARRMNDLFGGR